MSIFVHKVVSTLPAQLTANAVYAVRVGTGFDLYIANSTGSTAFRLNSVSFVVFTDSAQYAAYTPTTGQIALLASA